MKIFFKRKIEEERKAVEPKITAYQVYSFLDWENGGVFSALQTNKMSQDRG